MLASCRHADHCGCSASYTASSSCGAREASSHRNGRCWGAILVALTFLLSLGCQVDHLRPSPVSSRRRSEWQGDHSSRSRVTTASGGLPYPSFRHAVGCRASGDSKPGVANSGGAWGVSCDYWNLVGFSCLAILGYCVRGLWRGG